MLKRCNLIGMLANITLAALAILMFSLPTSAIAGGITRLSAMYTAIDGNVIAFSNTATPASGAIQIYNNSLKAPASNNVMYVTIQASELGEGQGIALNCQVDGKNCLNGTGTAGTGSVAAIPAGWVIPLGNEFAGGSIHGATGLGYQWCAPLGKTKGGIHTVVINAAPAFGGFEWMEAVSVFVDVSNIATNGGAANACGTYPTPSSGTSPD